MNFRRRFSGDGPGFENPLGSSYAPDLSNVVRTVDIDLGNARAVRVNRTHRVVQERARTIAARRSKIRSLWLPLLIFSTLLVGICIAVWAVLDEYELASAGTQVSSYQILVPLFWSVPVSAALLAVIWFRQTRREAGQGPVE